MGGSSPVLRSGSEEWIFDASSAAVVPFVICLALASIPAEEGIEGVGCETGSERHITAQGGVLGDVNSGSNWFFDVGEGHGGGGSVGGCVGDEAAVEALGSCSGRD